MSLIIDWLFPKKCFGCKKGKKYLCSKCVYDEETIIKIVSKFSGSNIIINYLKYLWDQKKFNYCSRIFHHFSHDNIVVNFKYLARQDNDEYVICYINSIFRYSVSNNLIIRLLDECEHYGSLFVHIINKIFTNHIFNDNERSLFLKNKCKINEQFLNDIIYHTTIFERNIYAGYIYYLYFNQIDNFIFSLYKNVLGYNIIHYLFDKNKILDRLLTLKLYTKIEQANIAILFEYCNTFDFEMHIKFVTLLLNQNINLSWFETFLIHCDKKYIIKMIYVIMSNNNIICNHIMRCNNIIEMLLSHVETNLLMDPIIGNKLIEQLRQFLKLNIQMKTHELEYAD